MLGKLGQRVLTRPVPSVRSITGPLTELDCNEIIPKNKKWRKVSNPCTEHRFMCHLKTDVAPLSLTAFSAVLNHVKGKQEKQNSHKINNSCNTN